jgi:hypothetical protein
MAFKMKGPSTHQGTKRHMMEVEYSSPAKGVFGVDITAPEKSDGVKAFEAEQRVKKDLAKKPLSKSQKEKVDKAIKSDNKFIEKADKRSEEGKITKPDKPGTVVSRAANKVGKKIKQGVEQKVADVKQDISDRKILKAKARKANDTPEKRLAAKKEKRTKFADQLEYIFLDGKRPDRLEARRNAKTAKKEEKNKEIPVVESVQNKTIPAPYDIGKIWNPDKPDTNMKDFGLNTQERSDEYDRRGWKRDKTSKVKKK